VPARLRFSDLPDAASKRNLLIRNISLGVLALRIVPPGPPFRLAHGEEFVGCEVKLKPQETMAFGIALDRTALADRRGVLCDFLVVKLDMCQGLPIDIVVAPEDMKKDEVQTFVKRSLSTVIASGALLPRPLAASGRTASQAMPGAAGSPASAECGGTDSTDAEENRRALGAAAEGDPPPLLAAYLGEVPQGAALRQGAPAATSSSGGAFPSAGHGGAWRGGDESPPDTPVGRPGLSSFEDDDRPPTPVPAGAAGYEKCRKQEASPAQRCHAQEVGPCAPGAPAQLPRPSSREEAPLQSFASTTAPQPATRRLISQRSTGSAGAHSVASMPAERGPELQQRRSAAAAAAAAGAPREPRPASLPAVRLPRGGGQPPPPPSLDSNKLTFVEGVGWCDDYGEVVASAASSPTGGGGGLRRMRSSSRGRSTQQVSLLASDPRKRPVESVKSRTGGAGIPKPGMLPLMKSGGSQRKLTQRELDDNWEAMGGI